MLFEVLESYLILAEALPASLRDRKFDENLEGASRLEPVRVPPPSRPLPLEFEALTLMLVQNI